MKNEINFPEWMNKDVVISALRDKEGSELYNFFGFKDSTSTTKFLNRFLPEKPKNIRWSTHLKNLLEIEVKVNPDIEVNIKVKDEVNIKVKDEVNIEKNIPEEPLYKKTKYDIMGDIFIETKGKSHIFVTEAQLHGIAKEDYKEYYQNRKKQMENPEYNPNYG